jgi:putative PEP-CTERM system histidine kinase
MFIQIAIWLQILFTLAAVGVVLVKRIYPAASLVLTAGLLCTAMSGYLNIQILKEPENLFLLYRSALLLQMVMTFGFYFYTKTAFRDNSEIYKGPGFWISIAIAGATFMVGLLTPLEGLIFSPDFAEERILYLTRSGFAVYVVQMFYLVFGLVQLERSLTSLHPLQRWSIKLEVIGSGLLLAGMALYLSQSLLYRSLNLNYLGLNALVGIAGAAFLMYSRLFRSTGSRLSLSRGIAHRSLVLLIVGGYLIILGVLSEGLHYFNLDYLKSIIYVMMLVGALGLAMLFLSEKLRRRLKVTLHKNFYQSKYDYREQWERFTSRVAANKTLETLQPAILDLFCDNLACRGASIYLLDDEDGTYHYSASFSYRRDWRPFPMDDPLIVQLGNRDWVINLNEVNPRLEQSIIKTFGDIGASLVVPMLFDEALIGFIVLGEQINCGEELTYEDYDLLRMLSRQSVASIQGLRLAEQLSLSRELASIGKLSTFVLHDLKNQVSGLSLMLDNAKEYISDPEFQDDMIETVETTVKNMKGLIARLKNVKEKPLLATSIVDLKKIATDAIETAGGGVDLCGGSVEVAADDEEIYKVVLNLLMNAKEASPVGGSVRVDCGQEDRQAYVRVIDKGSGMSPEFIAKRLFKPFETTKKHGFGIGLYQCRQIMETHGGAITVESREGEGTTFSLMLPLGE